MSFADLKNKRRDLSAMVEKATAQGEKTSQKDDRFWTPTRDKAGNGYAVIRFLPGQAHQSQAWVRYWEHAFKGPTGQWYIEKSLTSIDKSDPVGEENRRLWNSGNEADKVIVRERKRNLRHVANILVISDPANPDNEGKVFLYRFGKKIMDKILEKMNPQFPDEEAFDPTNLWEGADFVLKISKVAGYPNYDASNFKNPNPLMGGDETLLEQLYNKQHNLDEYTDPANYKSYDELKKRFHDVLGLSESKPAPAKSISEELSDDIPDFPSSPEPTSPSAPEPAMNTAAPSEDDDDFLAKFKSFADN